MNTAQILRKAKQLLSERSRWTQAQWARDGRGMGVGPEDPRAVCWCAGGAVYKVTENLNGQGITGQAMEILQRTAREAGFADLTGANDFGGYRAVMDIFNRSIRKLEAAA